MEKIKIAFFGHRDIYITDDQREQLKTMVSHLIDSYAFAEFYFGGYGRFDHDAYDCMREVAAACRCKCKFCYVLPYIYPKYLLRHSPPDGMYDELVYLGSENIPPKIAIIDRNKKNRKHMRYDHIRRDKNARGSIPNSKICRKKTYRPYQFSDKFYYSPFVIIFRRLPTALCCC